MIWGGFRYFSIEDVLAAKDEILRPAGLLNISIADKNKLLHERIIEKVFS
jgi:hypothetical protein